MTTLAPTGTFRLTRGRDVGCLQAQNGALICFAGDHDSLILVDKGPRRAPAVPKATGQYSVKGRVAANYDNLQKGMRATAVSNAHTLTVLEFGPPRKENELPIRL